MPTTVRFQPGWIVFGAEMGHCVRLFASRQLDTAEVEADYDAPVMGPYPYCLMEVAGPTKRGAVFTITARMRSWVVVDADTYAQAWERLFQHWSADNPQAETVGIEARKEIGS